MSENEKLKDLERIIDEYQDSMFRFAFFYTGSSADSQDIVQDLFLRIYENMDNLSIGNIKSYLFRGISNGCSNYFRQKRMSKSVPLDPLAARLAAENDNAEEVTKEYERIKALLDAIPAEQAEIIRLRTIGGLAFTEIAEMLDIPVTTVKSRFRYGIDKLKSKINLQETEYEVRRVY